MCSSLNVTAAFIARLNADVRHAGVRHAGVRHAALPLLLRERLLAGGGSLRDFCLPPALFNYSPKVCCCPPSFRPPPVVLVRRG